MAITNFSSFWSINNVDAVGGLGANEDITTQIKSINYNPSRKEIISVPTGKVANERITGRRNDPNLTITFVTEPVGYNREETRYEFSWTTELRRNNAGAETTKTTIVEAVCLGPAEVDYTHDNAERDFAINYNLRVASEQYAGAAEKELDYNWETGNFYRNGVAV